MPDGNPKFEKVPRKESIEFFKKFLDDHDKIVKNNILSPQKYDVDIKNSYGLKNRTLWLTNIYIISVSDIQEILSNDRNIDTIICASMWNSYTEEAKSLARTNELGLFTIPEFGGALNIEHKKYCLWPFKKKK